MGKRPFHPLASEGFVWRDPAVARTKLEGIRRAGSSLLHVVWDWDGTVVFEQGSTWHTMRDALPDQLQQQHKALYRHYKGLQDAGQLTGPLECEWSGRALTLHVQNGTPMADIRREAASTKTRLGAWAAFNACDRAEVPTVVLSAGVRDVILATAAAHNIHPTTVVATELVVRNGRVVGWRPDTMVDGTTKQEMGHPELSLLRELRPHAVLYGDQPHDARMFDGEGVRVRVDGVHNLGSAAWKGYLEESWEVGYDGVSIGDNLLAVASLNQWLVGDPQQSRAPLAPEIPGQPQGYDNRFSSQRPV